MSDIVYSLNGDDIWSDDFQIIIDEVMDNVHWTYSEFDEQQTQRYVINNCTYFTGTKKAPSQLIDASDVIDLLVDRGCGSGGEWADDYPDVPSVGIDELDRFLKEWYQKYCTPNWFEVTDTKEVKFEQGDFK